MLQNIILTENLCKSFGDREIIKMVNLNVKEGEVYGLLGPKGAGKTTILHLLAAYYTPSSGNIFLYGRDMLSEAKYKHHFGFLAKRTGFYEMLTARKNLEFFASLYGLHKKEIKSQVDILLDYVGLIQVAQKRVREFTPSMIQRLGLAKALIHNPEILILDEPLAEMDLQEIQLIKQIIQRFVREGKTILITSRYLAPVLEYCSTIGVLVSGKLVYQGQVEELLTEVKDCYHKFLVQVMEEGVYYVEGVLGILAEHGVQVEYYAKDRLIVTGSFLKENLQLWLQKVGITFGEICSLKVTDEELFTYYCSQHQDLKC